MADARGVDGEGAGRKGPLVLRVAFAACAAFACIVPGASATPPEHLLLVSDADVASVRTEKVDFTLAEASGGEFADSFEAAAEPEPEPEPGPEGEAWPPIAVSSAGRSEWEFVPLEVNDGQVAVRCGPGVFASWLIGTGAYVLQGDPVLELCPPEANQSVTCLAEASGYVVAEQAVGPDDDIDVAVPDGVLAVIEEREAREDDSKPVKCPRGVLFQSFLVSLGDIIHPGDAVALALPSSSGGATHCRTEVGGRVIALKEDLEEGQDVATIVPDRIVAYIGPPFAYDEHQTPATALLRTPADVGDTTIEVAGPIDAFGVGNLIRIASGGVSETQDVVDLGPAIHLGSGIRNFYPAGAEVTKLQEAGDGGGASGPPANWRPRSQLQGGLDPMPRSLRRLGSVSHGPGHQACEARRTSTEGSTTTEGTTTTTSSAEHEIEISFDANFSEVLATEDDKERFKEMLHEKYKHKGLKQVLDLREGSIIARLHFDRPVGPDLLQQLEELGCVAHKGKQLCPKGAEAELGGGVDPSGFPEAPKGSSQGGLLGRLGAAWLAAALVVIAGIALLALWACRLDRPPPPYDPVPTEDPGDGAVVIEFLDHHNNVQSKTFEYQPHGMILKRSGSPVKVEGFCSPSSYAKEDLQIHERWSISKIGGHSVRDKHFSEVDHILRSTTQTFEAYPLKIVFRVPGQPSRVEERLFRKSPLGLHIGHSTPCQVERVDVGGEAAGEDVRIGWEVTRIGWQEMHTMEPDEVIDILEKAEQHLPPQDTESSVRLDVLDAEEHHRIFYLDRHGHGLKLQAAANGRVKVSGLTCCSHAQRRGMREEMQILKVNGVPVDRESPRSLENRIHSQTENFHVLPLKLCFDKGHGNKVSVAFDKRPLGIEWAENHEHGGRHSELRTFKVKSLHIDSYAQSKGVQEGWTITKVGSEDLASVNTLQALQEKIDEGVDHLPWGLDHVLEGDRCLEVEFDDDGRRRVVHFGRWPHGMEFEPDAPARVRGFHVNSYAKERGVKPGWRVVRVHDENVNTLSGAQVTQHLERHAERIHLPVWPLRVELKARGHGHDSTRTVDFDRKPIGLVLTAGTPTRVDHFLPDSHAEAKGVEVGEEVLKIGNMQLRHDSLPMKCLEDGSKHLPEMDGPHLDVEFDKGSAELGEPRFEKFRLRRRPLGMQVDEHLCVLPFEFNSYAKTLNIEQGWKITRVGNEPVAPHSTTDSQVNDWLQNKSATLPPWPLRIVFNTGSTDKKTMYFYRSDLGIDWSSFLPLTVENIDPQSIAYRSPYGVRKDWFVVEVGDVTDLSGYTVEQVKSLLEDGWAQLDHSETGLTVEFEDPQTRRKHKKKFEYMPAGIKWSSSVPPSVEDFEFNSYAKHLRVEEGWRLKAVAGTQVRALNSGQVRQLWERKELDHGLQHWPLKLTFHTAPSGCCRGGRAQGGVADTKEIKFERRPLGLGFVVHSDKPLILKVVDTLPGPAGNARSQHVQKDWLITHIADCAVADCQVRVEKDRTQEVLAMLDEGLTRLRYVPPAPPGGSGRREGASPPAGLIGVFQPGIGFDTGENPPTRMYFKGKCCHPCTPCCAFPRSRKYIC